VATAVELAFDETADSRVREIWRDLDAHGVPSLGAAGGAFHPHVSLAVSEHTIDATAALAALAGDAKGLPLTLASLGFFPSPNGAVAFLGVTATHTLLDLNAAVDAELSRSGTEPWPLYRPGTWVPHCTLAMHVHHPEVVPTIVVDDRLPIRAEVTRVHVVEIRSGRTVATLA
jgi:2'-5' RNA ligase